MILLLIKHAAPTRDRSTSACRWTLSDQGRKACRPLARRIAAYAPAHLVSSAEAKAIETARLLAGELGIGGESRQGLHEHCRTTVPLFDSHAEFHRHVRELFHKPDQLIFGEETASAARQRFSAAVEQTITGWQHPGPVVIVAHGTVISLLAGTWCKRDPYDLWTQLGLPSYLVISLDDVHDDRRLVDIVPSVTAGQ